MNVIYIINYKILVLIHAVDTWDYLINFELNNNIFLHTMVSLEVRWYSAWFNILKHIISWSFLMRKCSYGFRKQPILIIKHNSYVDLFRTIIYFIYTITIWTLGRQLKPYECNKFELAYVWCDVIYRSNGFKKSEKNADIVYLPVGLPAFFSYDNSV